MILLLTKRNTDDPLPAEEAVECNINSEPFVRSSRVAWSVADVGIFAAIKSRRWPPTTSLRSLPPTGEDVRVPQPAVPKKKTMKLTVVFLSLAVALAMGQNYYLQFSGSSKDVQPAFQHLNDVAPYYRLDEVPFHDVPIRFRLIRAV